MKSIEKFEQKKKSVNRTSHRMIVNRSVVKIDI